MESVLFLIFFAVIAFFDLKEGEFYSFLLYPLFLAAFLKLWKTGLLEMLMMGAGAGSLAAVSLFFVRKGYMRSGDLWILLALFLFFGGRLFPVIWAVSFALHGLTGLLFCLRGQYKEELPFAPFAFTATLYAIICYNTPMLF